MSPAKRFTKKEIREDKLVTSAFRTSEYIQKNPKPFIIGGTVFAVVFAAILLYMWNSDKVENDATTLLARGRLAIEAGQPDQMVSDLEDLVNNYSGTEQAGIGALMLGDYFYAQKEYEKAIQYYGQIPEKYTADSIRLASAESGIAICNEYLGNREEAAKHFMKAAAAFTNYNWAPDYMQRAIENYLAAGDTTSAVDAINELFKKYETTSQGQAARRTLAEIAN